MCSRLKAVSCQTWDVAGRGVVGIGFSSCGVQQEWSVVEVCVVG